MRFLAVLAVTLAIAGPAAAQTIDVTHIATFDRAAFSQTVTECDRLAAHPDDPDKVAPGVAQAAVELARAIPACQQAVAADPRNPRLNYQLARTLGYAGRHAEAAPNRAAAVTAGYPQALFVVGYIMVTGWSGNAPDVCTGAELVRRSALAGRKAGLLGFPHYVVNGRFDACPVRKDKAELLQFLERAKPTIAGFYEDLLLTDLTARVKALP
jgi:hypothetical protein